MPNRFFWYDVMTTDVNAAGKFYGAVVGWTIDPPAPGSDYAVFKVGTRGVAGLMPIPEDARKAGMPPCWMGYIGVDDVAEAGRRLTREGGTLHRGPIEVPGIIRFAVVSDPQGAGFLIAKGLIHDAFPSLPPGSPGTVGWHELYAADGKTALPFYEKMFGWTKGDTVEMGPMGAYQLFATGGEAVGGIMTRPARVPRPVWGYYFNVEAIDAAAARVTQAGGMIVNGPHQVPGGNWIVQALDPMGAYFALTAPKR